MITFKQLFEHTEPIEKNPKYPGDIKPSEYRSLKDYQMGGAGEINRILRNGITRKEKIVSATNILNAIHKHKTTRKMTLYRAMTSKSYYHNLGDNAFTPGETKKLSGFQSTTTVHQFAKQFMKERQDQNLGHGYLLHIHVPRGSHAFDVDKHIGPYTLSYMGGYVTPEGQKEIILPHNAQYYVKSVENKGNIP